MQNLSEINNICTKFVLPFILCFCFYIQIFGEVSPGGGFQAGAIYASCIMAYDISVRKIDSDRLSKILPKISAIGVLIYLFTGLYSLLFDLNYLNYYSLGGDNPQADGIMIVELGVGITVSSVITHIYLELKNC